MKAPAPFVMVFILGILGATALQAQPAGSNLNFKETARDPREYKPEEKRANPNQDLTDKEKQYENEQANAGMLVRREQDAVRDLSKSTGQLLADFAREAADADAAAKSLALKNGKSLQEAITAGKLAREKAIAESRDHLVVSHLIVVGTADANTLSGLSGTQALDLMLNVEQQAQLSGLKGGKDVLQGLDPDELDGLKERLRRNPQQFSDIVSRIREQGFKNENGYSWQEFVSNMLAGKDLPIGTGKPGSGGKMPGGGGRGSGQGGGGHQAGGGQNSGGGGAGSDRPHPGDGREGGGGGRGGNDGSDRPGRGDLPGGANPPGTGGGGGGHGGGDGGTGGGTGGGKGTGTGSGGGSGGTSGTGDGGSGGTGGGGGTEGGTGGDGGGGSGEGGSGSGPEKMLMIYINPNEDDPPLFDWVEVPKEDNPMNDGLTGGTWTYLSAMLDLMLNGGRQTRAQAKTIAVKLGGGVSNPGDNPNATGGGSGTSLWLDSKHIFVKAGGGVDGRAERSADAFNPLDEKSINLRSGGGVTDPPKEGADGPAVPLVGFKGSAGGPGLAGPKPKSQATLALISPDTVAAAVVASENLQQSNP